MNAITRNRISSIDLLRGVVMVIMALDHVRDYFHYDAFFFDPSDLDKTNPALFFTRFITHFCAPVFVFLAGTSAFFVGQRLNRKSLSIWLLKRGFWLVIAEITLIKFAWTFSFDYSIVMIQVIWALGIGMICLAGFIHLPRNWVIGLCLLGVAAHNLTDGFTPAPGALSDIWTLLHVQDAIPFDSLTLFVAYPIIPWIFVMPLGYYFGELYHSDFDPGMRTRRLLQLGGVLTLLFFVLRFLNIYGDPYAWEANGSLSHDIMSFFNLTKYPPSLQYLLATLGPSILFLGFAEKWKGALTDNLVIVGRVPMFYYIIHIYIIHLLAMAAAALSGFSASDMIIKFWVSFEPQLQGYGFSLWFVYLIWIALVLALFPVCKVYNTFKSNNRHLWWLTYL